MNPDPLDTAEIAKAADPKAAVLGTTVEARAGKGSIDVEKIPAMTETSGDVMEYDDTPTEEEMQTLRRVSGQIPWSAFTIAFCKYLRATYPLFGMLCGSTLSQLQLEACAESRNIAKYTF